MKPIMNQEAVMMRARRALVRMASGSLARAAALLLLLLVAAASQPSGQTLPDTLEPLVWFSSPYDDETVSGTVTVDVDAYDASGIGGVILEVDGVAVGAEDTSAPWSFAWNADASGPGAHILTAVVRDNAGNATRSYVVPVVVGSDVTPPPPPPPVNHNPVAGGDSLTSTGRVAVSFSATSLLGNDSDPDGDPLAVTSVDSASTGGGTIASLGGGSYRYTPGATFTGTDTFTYAIADGRGGSASGTVSVTVTAPAPPPPPPTGGIVLALGFEEASGTAVVDSSASPINGTLGGGAAAPTRVAAGKFGRALSFDGGDSLSVPDGAAGTKLDLTNGMTLEAWVNPSSMNGWESVIYKERGGAGSGLLSYALYAHDGGTNTPPAAYVRTSSGGPDRGAQGAVRLPLNTWSHVAVTYATAPAPVGSTLRVYVNGVLVRTITGGNQNILAGNQPLRIGNSNASVSEGFNGVIDEVRIYNRALSAEEIAADMLAPVVP
jgi:hypothetical protein